MASLAFVKQKFCTIAASAMKPSKPTVAVPHLLVDLPGGKNPVSLLYELYSAGNELTIDDDMTSEMPGIFVARVQIEKQDFMVCQLAYSSLVDELCHNLFFC